MHVWSGHCVKLNLRYSQEERDKFDPFYTDDFTEELLEKHESEVEAIKTYFVENEALFARITKRLSKDSTFQ